MNKLFTLCVVASCMATTMFTSCKKSADAVVNAVDSATLAQTSGDGILYSMISTVVYKSFGPPFSNISNSALGWFGNSTKTVKAGSVSCNTIPLYDTLGLQGASNIWYSNSSNATGGLSLGFDVSKKTVSWTVAGNSTNNIPAFNKSDTTWWPVITNYDVPASISSTTGVTINYQYTNKGKGGAYDYLVRTITGSKGRLSDVISTDATSFTLSASDLAKIGVSGGNVTIQLTGLKLSPEYLVGGKSYRFAKQMVYTYSVTLN